MKNICIVSYYGLVESLFEAAQSFIKIGYNVTDFPMHKYIYDVNEKIKNYTESFINFINKNSIQIVMWWFINIDTDKFKTIKNKTGVKYVFYNWDEPFNWHLNDLENKSAYFDCVFVTCQQTLTNYLKNGCPLAFNLPPAFSPKMHFPIKDFNHIEYNQYACDISFCCTNLYNSPEYNDQYINRKKIVDDIYYFQDKYGYSFHIYGPNYLSALYPKSYRGYINYDKLHYLFHYSKINLCTHVVSSYTGYINERSILIGGSGGLLLVDNVKGIENYFLKNTEIYILEKDNYINQIVWILDNYITCYQMRNNLYETCIKKYTYDKWAQYIDNNYLSKLQN